MLHPRDSILLLLLLLLLLAVVVVVVVVVHPTSIKQEISNRH